MYHAVGPSIFHGVLNLKIQILEPIIVLFEDFFEFQHLLDDNFLVILFHKKSTLSTWSTTIRRTNDTWPFNLSSLFLKRLSSSLKRLNSSSRSPKTSSKSLVRSVASRKRISKSLLSMNLPVCLLSRLLFPSLYWNRN